MLRPALFLAAARAAVLVLSGLQVCLIARLPQGAAGVVFLHAALFAAFAAGIDLGTGQALQRLCAADALELEVTRPRGPLPLLSPDSQAWVRSALRARILAGLLALVTHLSLAVILGDGKDPFLVLAIFHLPVFALGAFQTPFLLRRDLRPLAAARLSGALLSFGAVLALRLSGVSLPGPYLLALASGQVLSHILLLRLSRIPIQGPAHPLGRLLPESLLLGAGNFARMLYFQGDQLLVRLLARPDLALYGAVYRLFSAATILPQSLGEILLAPLTRNHDQDPTSARRTAGRLSLRTLAAGLLPLGVLFLLARPVLDLLFGPLYTRGESTLRVLLAAALLVHPASVQITAALAAGRLGEVLHLSLLGLGLTVLLCLLLVPSMGALGAAWATLGTEALVLAGAWRIRR